MNFKEKTLFPNDVSTEHTTFSSAFKALYKKVDEMMNAGMVQQMHLDTCFLVEWPNDTDGVTAMSFPQAFKMACDIGLLTDQYQVNPDFVCEDEPHDSILEIFRDLPFQYAMEQNEIIAKHMTKAGDILEGAISEL